jgi:RNA polymerase-binding transcription factor DksA
MLTKQKITELHSKLNRMAPALRYRAALEATYPRKRLYSQRELEHFKRILLTKREEALSHLREYQESTKLLETNEPSIGSHHHVVSFLDRSLDAVNREETAVMMNRQAKFLRNIDDAIKRIEEGKYGVCIGCNRLIAKGRLEAVPHTQHCVGCKGGGTGLPRRAA